MQSCLVANGGWQASTLFAGNRLRKLGGRGIDAREGRALAYWFADAKLPGFGWQRDERGQLYLEE
ncbi:hypothetical protein B5K05_09795 [Rhizobium phaseoli]|nr:hypothetical protein B5K04_09765 [Rhizobium phaseoli]RDJ16436.1 hypothetical protein B5K05_09795 [Rhizobium phaseoli]